MIDYHIHTSLSFDCDAGMEDIAEAATGAGLKEICITEHHEFGLEIGGEQPRIDYTLYDEQIAHARRMFPQLTIRQGLEVGLQPHLLEVIEDDVKSRRWDFIIASQHVVDGKDPYDGGYFDGRTVREGQRAYLEEMLACLRRFDYYSVVGHIGYVDKYLSYSDERGARPFEHTDFPELLDEILKCVIGGGRGIEINTSNYHISSLPNPHPTIIKRFLELHGEIITLGSDAHHPQVVGYGLRQAAQLLKSMGAKYICRFEAMRPDYINIDEVIDGKAK